MRTLRNIGNVLFSAGASITYGVSSWQLLHIDPNSAHALPFKIVLPV